MPIYRGSWYQAPAFGWFDKEDRPGVTPPGGGLPFPMQQTYLGPAKQTGQMGYTPRNFPTASWKVEPRDEPRGLGSPPGMQAGDIPDNAVDTALASGPAGAGRREPQGPKMPTSLMDMFQPSGGYYDVGGKQQPQMGFGDLLAQRSNSLIGLGLGLMSGTREDPYGNALRGHAQGAHADQSRYQSAQNLAERKAERAQAQARQASQDAFQRSQAAQAQANFERQFARGGEKPPETREVFDPTQGRNVVQEFDPKMRQWGTATMGGGGTAAPGTAVVPGIGGGAAPGSQPVLPAKKPLTAHEQTAVDDAEKMLAANQAVISNLRDAKTLSPKAASGPYALERGQMGQHLPGFLGEGGKETVMLNNIVTTNAVEQLKAIFGGNPTEGERKILVELQGSGSASDAVRQDVFDRAIAAAEKRFETNRQKAVQIRGGTYYTPSGGAAGAPPQASEPAPSAAPRPGTVQKGYVFKGGDPSKEENWAPVR